MLDGSTFHGQAAALKPLDASRARVVRLSTVKPPSVLDPRGSRATSKSIIGPSFVQTHLMLSSNSSSEALIFSTSRSKLSLRTSSTSLG